MSNTTELLQVTPDLRILKPNPLGLDAVPLGLKAEPLGTLQGYGVLVRIQQAIGFALQAMPEDR